MTSPQKKARVSDRTALPFMLAIMLGAPPLRAQHQVVARVEFAALDPDHFENVSLAYGIEVGRQFGDRVGAFVRWMRQGGGDNGGPDIGSASRNYLGMSFEYALGPRVIRHNQVSLRADAGVMLRTEGLPAAPYFGGGVAVHYALSTGTAFVATFFDDRARLPSVTLYSCDPTLAPFCTQHYGARWQNNFGAAIAFEIRR